MRVMLSAFAVTIILIFGADLILNSVGYSTQEQTIGENVRVN